MAQQPEAFVYAPFGTLADADSDYFVESTAEEAEEMGVQSAVVDVNGRTDVIVLFTTGTDPTELSPYGARVARIGTESYDALLEQHDG